MRGTCRAYAECSWRDMLRRGQLSRRCYLRLPVLSLTTASQRVHLPDYCLMAHEKRYAKSTRLYLLASCLLVEKRCVASMCPHPCSNLSVQQL